MSSPAYHASVIFFFYQAKKGYGNRVEYMLWDTRSIDNYLKHFVH